MLLLEMETMNLLCQAIDYSLRLHDGPNALDSRAEIAAMEGNYQKAFNNQLKAFDVAPFASPYQPKLVTYWRTMNKENLEKKSSGSSVEFSKCNNRAKFGRVEKIYHRGYDVNIWRFKSN